MSKILEWFRAIPDWDNKYFDNQCFNQPPEGFKHTLEDDIRIRCIVFMMLEESMNATIHHPMLIELYKDLCKDILKVNPKSFTEPTDVDEVIIRPEIRKYIEKIINLSHLQETTGKERLIDGVDFLVENNLKKIVKGEICFTTRVVNKGPLIMLVELYKQVREQVDKMEVKDVENTG